MDVDGSIEGSAHRFLVKSVLQLLPAQHPAARRDQR